METKTHYRKVYKSKHLGVADLEEYKEEGMERFIFTIKEVRQFELIPGDKNSGITVGGRRGSHNIVYWTNPKIKPWALNAKNSKMLRDFFKSSFIQDWHNLTIELFIQNGVKSVSGGTTDGVRIKPILPVVKVKKQFTEDNFEAAKKANATIEKIKKAYLITPEMETKYIDYATK